jgi:hypothetical protein
MDAASPVAASSLPGEKHVRTHFVEYAKSKRNPPERRIAAQRALMDAAGRAVSIR